MSRWTIAALVPLAFGLAGCSKSSSPTPTAEEGNRPTPVSTTATDSDASLCTMVVAVTGMT